MDAAQIEKLARQVCRSWRSADPAIGQDDFLQLARIAIWKHRGKHPGRMVLAIKDALRTVKESIQYRTRTGQRRLPDGWDYEKESSAGSDVKTALGPRVLDQLEKSSDAQRRVIELTLQGYTTHGVAHEMGVCRQTVERHKRLVVSRLRDRNGNS